MIDSLYYDGNCSCGCNGSHFSNAAPMVPLNIIEAFKRRVYDGMKRGTIDKQMWQAVLHVVSEGIVDGLMESGAATHEEAFLRELRHSAEVFSAFKVHTMADNMRSMLVKPNGRLKSFSEWSNDVAPIAAHHVGSWLQTEYDTAVIRAHNAADWQEFERNIDIMPNLRWMPTTSPHPESSHKAFWQKQLTLPVDDEFWVQHHPGDRWNCKCSLEATDEPATPELKAELSGENMPQRGLENNPGKDAHVFNDTHPYFPKSCEQCAFYKPGMKNRLKTMFINRNKDCYNCPYLEGCLPSGFKEDAKYKDRLLISNIADPHDLQDNKRVAHALLDSFPDMEIKIRPNIFIKNKPNPEFEINGLIGDNKRIQGEQGVTSGFKKAIKQGASVVIIDLDAHLKRLEIIPLSVHIFNRRNDFIKGVIRECYVVYKGKAVKINIENIAKPEIQKELKKLE